MTLVFILLSLALFLTASKIIAQIIRQGYHLDEQTLHDFYTGQLKEREEDYDRVIRHLGICKECQDRLREFSFGRDITDHLVE